MVLKILFFAWSINSVNLRLKSLKIKAYKKLINNPSFRDESQGTGAKILNTSATQLINNQSNSPLVSVIMNCLNCEKYLREAIDSVYEQTYSNWEIIFWDNASTDRSAEIAHSYGERLRYFRGDHTVPLGKARNFAIAKATGKYIAYLDCDDLWLPQKLEFQVKKIESDPGLGLVYSDCFFMDKDGNLLKRFFQRITPQEGGLAWFGILTRPNFIPSPTPLMRLSIVKELGGLNEDLSYCEGFELFLRIAFKHKIAYINEPLAKYRLHAFNLTGKGTSGTTKEQIYLINNFSKSLHFLPLSEMLMVKKRISELRCKLLMQYLLGK